MPIYLVCYTIAGPPVKYIFRNSAIAPHDFSFTDNYYVFVENRAEGDTLPYLLGNCTTLRYTTQYNSALYYTGLHCAHSTTLPYTTLQHIALYHSRQHLKKSQLTVLCMTLSSYLFHAIYSFIH